MRGVDLRRFLRDLQRRVDEMPCVRCSVRIPYFAVCIDPAHEDVEFDDAPCPVCGREATLVVYELERPPLDWKKTSSMPHPLIP